MQPSPWGLRRRGRASSLPLSLHGWLTLCCVWPDADSEMERTFFRGLSRRMSNLGSGRKAAYVQRSMRDLGIESLDDEDIKPEFIKYDSF